MPDNAAKPSGPSGEGASKPSRIGGFELLATLGKGGMGTVFKSRQVSMDRVVALKVLPPNLAKNQDFVQRFLREARSAAKLNHPNIVQGFDVGEADGVYYFAMEFVDGPTLKDLIKREGRIEEKKALNILGGVARALEHAHRHGLIHRDIKPDNVMISRDGVVKLADLGLARSTGKVDTVTIEGVTVGTPHYMAPEQVRGQADLDTRCDIYALGATLYHMATGAFPFEGPNAAAIMAKHLAEEPPNPKEKNPQLSRPTCDLILRMMAKDPADRPQTPTDLLAEIRDALEGKVKLRAAATLALPAHRGAKSAPPVHSVHPVHSSPRRSSLPWLLVAGGVLLAAIAGFILLRPGGTAKPQAKEQEDRTAKDAKIAKVEETPKIQPGPKATPEVPTVKKQPPVELPEPPKKQPTPEPPAPAPAEMAKWEAIKADAKKLIDAGKLDEAAKLLDGAKALPLDGIADLVAEQMESIEAAKAAQRKAALAAYAKESDKVWTFFKERKYAEADKLLASLAASLPKVSHLREGIAQALQADQEAAALLKEFWSAVERGVAARKGTVSIEGATGNITGVENGVITLQTANGPETRRVDQLKAKPAVTYAAFVSKGDERSHLVEAIFRIAEAEEPPLAEKALDAAGNPPGLAFYKDRLAPLLGAKVAKPVEPTPEVKPIAAPKAEKWVSLFDGKSLDGWRAAEGGPWHGGHGKIEVLAGRIILGVGANHTGIVSTRKLSTMDYEISVEAMRVEGHDTFCSILFPVGSSDCALGVGGWEQGGVVGLDLLDGLSGNRNVSTRRMDFERGRWYRVSIRVTKARIQAWIDDAKVIDLETAGHRLEASAGFAPLRPLGVDAANTKAALRNVRFRRVDPKAEDAAERTPEPVAEDLKAGKWVGLFDGKTLKGWQAVKLPQDKSGKAYIENGRIVLDMVPGAGNAVTWAGDFPAMDYEFEFDVTKLVGEFLCNITFPVAGSHCNLNLGETAGLDVVDWKRAWENDTTTKLRIKPGQRYTCRLRVTEPRVQVWFQGVRIMDLPTEGHKFMLNPGWVPVKSIALCTWNTGASFANIRFRRLDSKADEGAQKTPEPAAEDLKAGKSVSLFDGKTLEGWKPLDAHPFAHQGRIDFKDNELVFEKGGPCTGIQYTGSLPKCDYELSVEAQSHSKIGGFFLVAFQIDASATLVGVGAREDGKIEASMNVVSESEKKTIAKTRFEEGRWYRIRVRVTKSRVLVLLDEEKLFDFARPQHTFRMPDQWSAFVPPGIANYDTVTSLRNIQIRRLRE